MSAELAAIHEQRERLFDCLNRFVRAEDAELSDHELAHAVFRRWAVDRDVHLGDPGDGVVLEVEE